MAKRASVTTSSRPPFAALAAGLAIAVVICFWPVTRNGFIDTLDDDKYVTQNPHVQRGLDAESLRWALTTSTASNWHPLTWVSHMVDYSLFGASASGHHATSLVLHAANVLLLFALLVRLTGGVGRSFAASLLFAIHPLRLESVAWVAERKDVLSGLLFMLTLWAYLRYADRPGPRRMALVASTLALGLAAKPMLVTTPFVLLLLDVWPLARARTVGARRMVLEKAPLFALSAGSVAVTLWVQRAHAIRTLQEFPFATRAANAIVSYAVYLGKFLWPSDLAVIYPHPGADLPAWKVGVAAGVLIAITSGALKYGRRHPCLPIGWLWYVGMLVPVIGLVQVGQQAMADRYTYLPSIGLSLMIAWSVPATRAAAGALVVAAIALGVGTWHQAAYWRDSTSLLTRAIAVTRDNGIAQLDLGLALYGQGKLDEAIAHFRESVRIWPRFESGHSNLGVALGDRGRTDEAIAELRVAMELDPTDPDVYNNLGSILYRSGRLDGAIEQFRHALQLHPGHAGACYNLGTALAARGDWVEAASILREAIRLDPRNPAPHSNLAAALLGQGDYPGAWREVHATRALGGEPPAGLLAKLAASTPEPK